MTSMDPHLRQAARVLAVAVVLWWSWQRGYQAVVHAYARDRAELATLTRRLSQLEALVQAEGGEAAWLSRNQQRLAVLKGKFPSQTQVPQLLNALVDALKTGEIRLLNVSQGNLEPVEESGGPLLIDGAPCYRLAVAITAEGRYYSVLDALERLTADSFPALVTLERVDLTRKEALGARLDTTLQLHLYVVGSSSPPTPNAPPSS